MNFFYESELSAIQTSAMPLQSTNITECLSFASVCTRLEEDWVRRHFPLLWVVHILSANKTCKYVFFYLKVRKKLNMIISKNIDKAMEEIFDFCKIFTIVEQRGENLRGRE